MARMTNGVADHRRERRRPNRIGMGFEIGEELSMGLRRDREIIAANQAETEYDHPALALGILDCGDQIGAGCVREGKWPGTFIGSRGGSALRV